MLRQIDRYWSGEIVLRTAKSMGLQSLVETDFDAELLSDDNSGEFSNFELTSEEFEKHWSRHVNDFGDAS